MRVVEAVAHAGATVPALFWFEIRNVLVVNERRGRLTPTQTGQFLSYLEVLPLEVASSIPGSAVVVLAREHRLSVYDAAYLDLAHRLQAPLATLDKELRSAAPKLSIPIF